MRYDERLTGDGACSDLDTPLCRVDLSVSQESASFRPSASVSEAALLRAQQIEKQAIQSRLNGRDELNGGDELNGRDES